jgi:dihydrofolate reductase
MRKITAVESVTLDGVMQSPGGTEEDPRGGFREGGWAHPYVDDVLLREMSTGFGNSELLFGRRTYEQFFSYWPNAPRPNPFTDVLNDTRKYVASTTLSEPLPWVNSVLLGGDAVARVGALKALPGEDLVVLGSGELVRALMGKDLIDGLVLVIHPLVLGSGRRLFPENGPSARLRLTDSVPTTTGVVIARYERVRVGAEDDGSTSPTLKEAVR